MHDDPPWDGPRLSPEGVVEGKPATPVSAPAESQPEEPPLELAERPRPPRAVAPALSSTAGVAGDTRRRWWTLVAAASFSAGLLLLGYAALRPTPRPLAPVVVPELVRDAIPALGPPLVIDSTPSGAEIVAPDGRVLGVTPWGGNNPFLVEATVTLRRPGFRPGLLRVQGAREQTLHVTLTPR